MDEIENEQILSIVSKAHHLHYKRQLNLMKVQINKQQKLFRR